MEQQYTYQLATVALNLSAALSVGCCLSAAWLSKASSPWAVQRRQRLHTLVCWGLGGAALADVALLWLQAASMAELPLLQAGPAVFMTLSATHFGRGWIVGAAALMVAALAAALPLREAPGAAPRSPSPLLVALAALAAFFYSRSMLSHAAADGAVSWRVAADWLHLMLISVWVGEVFVAGLSTLREPRRENALGRDEQARYIEALSTSATVALGGIIVSGLYSSWRAIGSLENVMGHPYVSVLLLKLTLVAGAALLGGFNRLWVMPALLLALRGNGAEAEHGSRRFALVLQAEAVVLAAVLVVAALLSSTSPPSAG